MSISIGEGLRMMQGGVDRTGFADMADSLGSRHGFDRSEKSC